MKMEYELTEVVFRRIKHQVFRIMKNKLKGEQSEQVKTIYRMIKIAEDIYQRYRVYPYQFQLKHLKWWRDEVGFWIVSEWTEYRYELAIKKYCSCRNKEQWFSLIFDE